MVIQAGRQQWRIRWRVHAIDMQQVFQLLLNFLYSIVLCILFCGRISKKGHKWPFFSFVVTLEKDPNRHQIICHSTKHAYISTYIQYIKILKLKRCFLFSSSINSPYITNLSIGTRTRIVLITCFEKLSKIAKQEKSTREKLSMGHIGTAKV